MSAFEKSSRPSIENSSSRNACACFQRSRCFLRTSSLRWPLFPVRDPGGSLQRACTVSPPRIRAAVLDGAAFCTEPLPKNFSISASTRCNKVDLPVPAGPISTSNNSGNGDAMPPLSTFLTLCIQRAKCSRPRACFTLMLPTTGIRNSSDLIKWKAASSTTVGDCESPKVVLESIWSSKGASFNSQRRLSDEADGATTSTEHITSSGSILL